MARAVFRSSVPSCSAASPPILQIPSFPSLKLQVTAYAGFKVHECWLAPVLPPASRTNLEGQTSPFDAVNSGDAI